MYGKEPWYDEPISPVPWLLTKSRFHCTDNRRKISHPRTEKNWRVINSPKTSAFTELLSTFYFLLKSNMALNYDSPLGKRNSDEKICYILSLSFADIHWDIQLMQERGQNLFVIPSKRNLKSKKKEWYWE